jgi:dethiobiotin synthetase
MNDSLTKEKRELINISLIELIRLNQIKLKNEQMQLENVDCIISIFSKIKDINIDTTIEELEQVQSQIRAMLNQTEEKMKEIENEKKFVEELQKREISQ